MSYIIINIENLSLIICLFTSLQLYLKRLDILNKKETHNKFSYKTELFKKYFEKKEIVIQ